jgi:hypothetical protein
LNVEFILMVLSVSIERRGRRTAMIGFRYIEFVAEGGVERRALLADGLFKSESTRGVVRRVDI